jgi:hypothetical protein
VSKGQFNITQKRNRVYQHETQRYVENIPHIAIDFNPVALGFREFISSAHKNLQLRMADRDASRGLTKVYWVLQNASFTPNYSSEVHYTITGLERLLTVNRRIKLNALLATMETPHLQMIACGTNQLVNDEVENIFKELFNILKQKKSVKIILPIYLESGISAILQQIAAETLDEGFVTTDEQLTWSDLTTSSQRKILEKTVVFQGTRVALNQIVSVESITESFLLAKLLQKTELTIS